MGTGGMLGWGEMSQEQLMCSEPSGPLAGLPLPGMHGVHKWLRAFPCLFPPPSLSSHKNKLKAGQAERF